MKEKPKNFIFPFLMKKTVLFFELYITKQSPTFFLSPTSINFYKQHCHVYNNLQVSLRVYDAGGTAIFWSVAIRLIYFNSVMTVLRLCIILTCFEEKVLIFVSWKHMFRVIDNNQSVYEYFVGYISCDSVK